MSKTHAKVCEDCGQMFLGVEGDGMTVCDDCYDLRTCEDCGEVLPLTTPYYQYRCDECENPECPRCGERVNYTELNFPEHYEGKLDDRFKVCDACQTEYDDHRQELLDQAQEEADEWFEGSY